ncbi:MAG TPA: AI-2E family transporter [Candidatus Dormibacteraeota bacterium]|nr:AI-2E family transporter [Candidatus Dormibacteraeota bacterium]
MKTVQQPVATSGDRLTTVLFYAVLFLLAYLVFRIFEPFLVPLGWAVVLVVFFYPLQARLEPRLGKSRAAFVSTAGVALILVLPSLALLSTFVREGLDASRGIERAVVDGQMASITRLWTWVTQHAPAAAASGGIADLPTLVRGWSARVAEFLAARLGTVLRNVLAILFDLFVTIFALFYIFRDADAIVRVMRGLLPLEQEHREKMIGEARDLIFASVTTSLIIAAIQGTLGGIAFALVRLPTPFFWGVCMAFFSLVPVIGSGLIFVPAALWLAFTGHWGKALILVAVCAGVSTVVDSLLRPILLSGRAQLSGLVVFISVIGGVEVFGVLGLVLGPIVLATAAGLLDVYIKEREASAPAGV